MFSILTNFFTTTPLWQLLLIFFAKIVEVAIATLRIILISKGNRRVGVFLALIEISLWIVIAGNVITELHKSPIKAVVYGLGFAVGVYLGSLLEQLLAFGKVLIQAVVSEENGELVAQELRNKGFGVTSLIGHGKDKQRTILMIYTNRKDIKITVKTITSVEPKAMIISNESLSLSGGFTKQIRHLFK